jgi:hypothetical protein
MMILRGPKKTDLTIKALELFSHEEALATTAQVYFSAGKMTREDANALIEDFNNKFLSVSDQKSFTKKLV